jgi:CDP-glycerol glycerophosphotransferase (TagB/SpsB family)
VEADILIAAASSVAFEAAALGLPVLLWHSDAPRWVREAHLVTPWSESLPGMFSDAGEFSALVGALIDEPAEGLRVAGELARHLARYAQPFDSASFARALERLAA